MSPAKSPTLASRSSGHRSRNRRSRQFEGTLGAKGSIRWTPRTEVRREFHHLRADETEPPARLAFEDNSESDGRLGSAPAIREPSDPSYAGPSLFFGLSTLRGRELR